ncbi:hypothetical protein TU51_20190 [Bacillus cytotoxicus]|nr:hypothetical protein TU51_20190 [Bacillus cytotoxicus]
MFRHYQVLLFAYTCVVWDIYKKHKHVYDLTFIREVGIIGDKVNIFLSREVEGLAQRNPATAMQVLIPAEHICSER